MADLPTRDQALFAAVRTMLRPREDTTTFLRDGFSTMAEAVQTVCREWPLLTTAGRIAIRSEINRLDEAEREPWEPVIQLILEMP